MIILLWKLGGYILKLLAKPGFGERSKDRSLQGNKKTIWEAHNEKGLY